MLSVIANIRKYVTVRVLIDLIRKVNVNFIGCDGWKNRAIIKRQLRRMLMWHDFVVMVMKRLNRSTTTASIK